MNDTTIPTAQSGPVQSLVRLARPAPDPVRYPEDIKVLSAALRVLGFEASEHDIEWAYEQVSEEMCDGWLVMSVWNRPECAARAVLGYLEPNAQVRDAAPTNTTNEG